DGGDTGKARQIEIEKDSFFTHETNCLRHVLNWNDILSHSSSPSGKQSRHLDDSCIENVEDELRGDADDEHEQCHRNDDELFASQEIGERAATFGQGTAEERLHGARKCNRRDEQANYCDSGERSRHRERAFENEKFANESI